MLPQLDQCLIRKNDIIPSPVPIVSPIHQSLSNIDLRDGRFANCDASVDVVFMSDSLNGCATDVAKTLCDLPPTIPIVLLHLSKDPLLHSRCVYCARATWAWPITGRAILLVLPYGAVDGVSGAIKLEG